MAGTLTTLRCGMSPAFIRSFTARNKWTEVKWSVWMNVTQDYLDLLEPALESPTGSGPADSQYSSMSSDSIAGSCQSIVHTRL